MKGLRFRIFLSIFCIFALVLTVNAQCLTGNCQNGTGTFMFSGGAKYNGQFYSGKPHGTGTLSFTNGNNYTGDWKDGIREGKGKMNFKNGNKYEGEFKRGKISGTGSMYYQNGDKYVGKWDNESPNGKGIYYFKTKERYEGEFINGKFEGKGSMIYPDGTKFTGNWKDNRKNGNGKFVKSDGSVLEGSWVNGELVNKTKPNSSNNDISIAETTPAKPDISGLRSCNTVYCKNGKGVFDYPDGSRWIGNFKEGYPEGDGACYYSNGDKYEGEWSQNAPHGDGIMYFASGRVYGATWMNGSPIKELDSSEQIAEDEPVNVEASKKVKVWAVIVGVGRYSHMPTLKFTDDDAYQIYAFLKSPEGGAIPENQISLLIDEAATRESILRSMRQLFLKADANDVVMMYFSGHGLEGSFLPVDYDGYNNKLRHDEVKKIFGESKAKHKLCIADACHSGTLNEGLAAKGPMTVTLNKYYEAFENTEGGTALLMSSKGAELSLEDHGLRQGVFSHYLLKGLKGAADKNGDTIVTIREIYEFVYGKVREYTGNAQNPILTGDFDEKMPVSIRR
jgi:hypothetical protein